MLSYHRPMLISSLEKASTHRFKAVILHARNILSTNDTYLNWKHLNHTFSYIFHIQSKQMLSHSTLHFNTVSTVMLAKPTTHCGVNNDNSNYFHRQHLTSVVAVPISGPSVNRILNCSEFCKNTQTVQNDFN